MSTQTIVRAWKDESYRSSLSETEKAALPANPAGVIALSSSKSGQAALGYTLYPVCTGLTCIGCSHLACV